MLHNNEMFSVEGIHSLKNDLSEKQRAEMEAAKQKVTAVKQEQNLLKKMALEKEKQTKMEDIRMARLLHMKITRRFPAFPILLEKIPQLPSKPTLGELIETDEMQKLELDLQGSEQRFVNIISQGGHFLESVWGDGSKMTFLPPQLRFDLTNFGKVVNSDIFMREARPLMTETIIEYPWICQMGLAMRWGQCILNAVLIVHQMNSNPAFRKLVSGKRGPVDTSPQSMGEGDGEGEGGEGDESESGCVENNNNNRGDCNNKPMHV